MYGVHPTLSELCFAARGSRSLCSSHSRVGGQASSSRVGGQEAVGCHAGTARAQRTILNSNAIYPLCTPVSPARSYRTAQVDDDDRWRGAVLVQAQM